MSWLNFLGACLPWRYAIGSTVIIPLLCFVILLFCPESPAWLMSKGREGDARAALEKLRGAKNTDLIDAEVLRISTNLKMSEEDSQDVTDPRSNIRNLMSSSSFLKPLGILLFVFCIGYEWTGLTAIAFYNVPLLM